MKLMFTEQKSGLSNAIFKNIGDNISNFNIVGFDEVQDKIADDDLCVVVKSAYANTIFSEFSAKVKKLESRLQSVVMTVGIPPHIIGFRFLKDAVKCAVQEPEIINHMTKVLYPKIAEANNTTSSRVERAIRNAIEVSWKRGKIENINRLFGMEVFKKEEKPTNGELIALLADKLLLEC